VVSPKGARSRFVYVSAFGAALGVLLVLHTWGQTLQHHPHVHGVVTGGGLSCDADSVLDDAPRWVACRPVRVLGRVFRGKFLDGLRAVVCDLCSGQPGKVPACVNACPHDAAIRFNARTDSPPR
jgi:Putative transposase